ncbi:MAG: tetratricopeptide repeat protein [Spirochaetes bacterium]|nr:tetratricopeptide repeat protein [Spirochaetota bacterium]
MSANRKNRISSVDNNSGSDDFQIKHNRISRIEAVRSELTKRKYISFIVLPAIAVLVIAAVIIITSYYKKPQIFKPSDNTVTFADLEKKGIPAVKSSNALLEKGKDNYNKGYYNNAVSDFNEVVESDSSNQDKSTALTYIGIIYDERGNYDKAVEHYLRALKYDKNSVIAYRNLAIAYRHKKDYSNAEEAVRNVLKIDSQNVQNLILLGNILFEQGRYKDAIKEYGEALKISTDEPVALHNTALALLRTGDELSGIEYLKKAGAADKSGNIAGLAYSKLGVIYLERKDYSFAEKYLRMAVSINPEDPAARYNLGIVYLKINKPDNALIEFSKAEELGRNDEMLLESLGDTYYDLNEYDKSIETFNRLLDTNRRNIRVLSRLAEVYHKKGDPEKAFDLYKRITVIEPATENARVAYINMANILDDMGQSEEAINTYNKALTIDENDDSTLYNMGIAYKNAGKPELAVQSWKKAWELNSDSPKPLLAIAGVYEDKELYDLAIEEYERIVKRWADLQEAHFQLAGLYYKKSLYDYSMEEYRKVVEINGNNDLARKALINLGMIISANADSEEKLDEAQSYIQKALLQKPNDAEALISLGNVYYKKGMLDEAIDTFYMVISSSRDSRIIAEAYNNIGKSYHNKGEYQKALKAFTLGIDEDPTMEEIRINRKVSMQAYESELHAE